MGQVSRTLLLAAAWLVGHSFALADGGLTSLLQPSFPAVAPVTVFTAKQIHTMEVANPRAAAVAVAGGRILAVGSLADVRQALGDRPFTLDETFKDKFLLPGLIDQHLHPILGALTLAVDVIAPEDWVLPAKTSKAANSPGEYLDRLTAGERAARAGEWYFSWGYHPLWHGPLSRKTLDGFSQTRPVVVWHRSCHEFYLNTAALKAIGLTAEMTKGKGLASEQSSFADGHFWEQGMTFVIAPVLKRLATPERFAAGLRQMIAYLHQNGVTAFNEPGALVTPEVWKLYQDILGAEETPLYSTFLADGRGIVDRVGLDKALAETEKEVARSTTGKLAFLPRQVKLFADGAIISQLMQMKDGYKDGHKGEWILAPDDLDRRSKLYWDAGYQLHVHVNGDLGLDVVLDTIERRMRDKPRADHRTVIVHFANSTEDQVARLARLGCIVSANPYYTVGFADKFAAGLGKERADALVRSNSVVRRKVPLSFHSDLPMGPAAPLYLAWCGVNRITPAGRVAGPDQRITVEQALRAVTIEAAYSWRKEHELGSVAPGKIANFTVLDQDPLAVNPTALKDVGVWGTVFQGRKFPVEKAGKVGAAPAGPRGWDDRRPAAAPPRTRFADMNPMLELTGRDPRCRTSCTCGRGIGHSLLRATSGNLAETGRKP